MPLSGGLTALEPLACLLSEVVALLQLQDLPSLGTGSRLWANRVRLGSDGGVPRLLPCSAAPATRADPPACLREGSPTRQPSCGQLPL